MIFNFLFLFWPSLISRFEKLFRAFYSCTTEEPARGYAERLELFYRRKRRQRGTAFNSGERQSLFSLLPFVQTLFSGRFTEANEGSQVCDHWSPRAASGNPARAYAESLEIFCVKPRITRISRIRGL
jgi:hypothetical protein